MIGVPHRHLTDAERAFLIETHSRLSAVEQARALNYNYDNLCFQRQRLIRQGLIVPHRRKYARPYTPAEDAELIALVEAGNSLKTIGRKLHRSVSSLYTHINADLGGLRQLRQNPTSSVRTSSEVAVLFGLTKTTITKWIHRGWLESKNNRIFTAHCRKPPQLVTDEALQLFMTKRELWPALCSE